MPLSHWLRLGRSWLLVGLIAGNLLGRASAEPPALTPEQSLERFKVADGFEVQLFASEPDVRQPVTMTFDSRGRIWVIQYLQYPAPAGLTPVEVDRYLRTKYDRVPEPPPRGPRGADRITILEDTDGDGRADRAKDFVTGLNLASALAIGHGGIFVGQAPYLLFYPDRNGDDVPDGDPEVLLQGFGLEDAHAVVNSMQWGPDGWLYGTQGSTVTADIRGVGFQQGIWRYHPITRKFELFSEGGGNTWGLDFDRHGNALAGTNYGNVVLLHQVQGGYYVKGFSKHGPLHNPYTYGYFEHAPHEGWRGGHVTCGGVVYDADRFPSQFRHSYIAANLLSNAIYWHAIEPNGSTYKTRYQGELLSTDDIWFRPIDCLLGPDGCIYVADWYDKRANHVIPEDTWDRSNGRIWKIAPRGSQPLAQFNLADRSSYQLVDLLSHSNDWYAREARRLLAERRDPSILPRLRTLLESGDDRTELQALWALYVSGGWNNELAAQLLDHANADVRLWTIRLLGDDRQVIPQIASRLTQLAASEPNPRVRSQLACTARRLPAGQALPVITALLKRSEDIDDPHIPLLLWWAIQDKAISDRQEVVRMISARETWALPITSRYIVERLARRYAAEQSAAGYEAVAQLLSAAPDETGAMLILKGLEKELAGRRLPAVPAALERPLAEMWSKQESNPGIVRLALRLGSQPAYQRAWQLALDSRQPEAERIAFIQAIGQAGQTDAIDRLLELLRGSHTEAIRLAALAALEHFSQPEIAEQVLTGYDQFTPPLRARAVSLLCSRGPWAYALLVAVEGGTVNPQEISIDQLRQMLLHKDDRIASLIEQRWGKVREATPGEKQAQIVVLARTLTEGEGHRESGHRLFTKHCANCHMLHGQGTKIGPDLSSADRKNRDFLLLNIVDPSNSVRPEYIAQTIVTNDGRVLSGLVIESNAQTVTLVDAKNQRTTVPHSEIEQIRPSEQSLMPEKLLEPLAAQELRDLFRYLQSDPPAQASTGK